MTLPLIMPGVLSAALLAFALSIDDFVITNFNSGSTITFPLFIWGAARVAIPPQIYVIATMIFLFTVAMMILTVWQQRRAEKLAAVRPDEPELAAGPLAARRPRVSARRADRSRARAVRAQTTRARASCTSRRAASLLAGVPDVVDGDVGGRLPALPRARRAARRSWTSTAHEYADFCLGDTGAMAGHSPEPTMRAIARHRGHHDDAADRGRRAGSGAELARRFGVPYWQFSLTATDANRWMLRMCRQVTGRAADRASSTGATTARSTSRS